MGLQGEKCASNKTDVWAANLTMMKILVGDDAVKSAIKYVSNAYVYISIMWVSFFILIIADKVL